jgi:uncharacterized protein DUF6680
VGGPIAAVIITRLLDDWRQDKARRMEVFRTLMRTRRSVLQPDHIGALNLVEIEFARDEAVLAAWKALFTHFATAHPRQEHERIDMIANEEEIKSRNQAFGTRIIQERQSFLAKLLHAMARALGFKIEQLEIFEGGYTPQFWVDVDSEQDIMRKYVVELARGTKIVPIGVFDYRVMTPVEAPQSNVNQQAAQ